MTTLHEVGRKDLWSRANALTYACRGFETSAATGNGGSGGGASGGAGGGSVGGSGEFASAAELARRVDAIAAAVERGDGEGQGLYDRKRCAPPLLFIQVGLVESA